MTRTVRLRPWQKAALDRFLAAESADFLTVATPGAGKTTFALTAARHQLATRPSRLVVVAPTAHLKTQWARAAAALSLHLDPSWSASDGAPSADMHGIVTSYQQVAASASALARLAQGAFVILDEIHHAADERAWGAAVLHAFTGAHRRLALSGTPFRSDTRAIPFVNYQHDEAVPDYEYGYGDALADGRVVRPVYFPRTNGDMEWAAPDGSLQAASFDDPLDAARASQRLRTALSLDGDWLVSVLRAANDRLRTIRSEHPEAGGLVIATDQEHARAIAAVLQTRFGMTTRVATSDDPGASRVIETFARSQDPWLVAVRMVSEGRRHPASAGRGLRHDDHDRAVLPPGGGPPRPLDARRAAPARVSVHPRRRAASDAGLDDRRAAPPLAAPPRERGGVRARARRGAEAATGRRAALALRGHLGSGHRRRRPDGRRGLARSA